MVKVNKGDWDKSRGAEENHNFNREWLMRCQRVLKPNGTIWVTNGNPKPPQQRTLVAELEALTSVSPDHKS
jgi:DNA modification methylase